jgi:uncharacterized protein YdeI (YjbR/CyaY-like superfamily)
MKNTSPDVDRYIENAAPFAQPILKRLRRAFHAAHPEIGETMKWGAPFFEYKGIVGSMAAFKSYVRWGFWKGKLMQGGAPRMGETKVSEVSELPSDDVLIAWVREAVRLNEDGTKIEKPARKPRPEAEVPADLAAALKKAPKAAKAFKEFPPSHRREYVQWITEAKQDATRRKRIATAVEWLLEGKPRNWKYMKSSRRDGRS